MLSRRSFLGHAMLSASIFGSRLPQALASSSKLDFPPVRRITSGPKYHWFGYYDKLQFCPQNRLVLSNQVDFEHRSPTKDDAIAVGVVDTHDGDRWTELGTSKAWGWQQGCMLQWLPGTKKEVIWNDRDGDQFVSHILNLDSRCRRTLPTPIYNISPDGTFAVTTDFARLNDRRPGYGYAGIVDPNREIAAPEDTGIWTVDLATGSRRLIMSLEDAARIPYTGRDDLRFRTESKHWFNHLLLNSNGTRLWFLHRWSLGRGFGTRAFTINLDGSDPYILDPHGATSHFVWRDPQHVMAWSWHPSHGSKFYLYKDKSDIVEPVGLGIMTENGHNTYVPCTNSEWVLNDTYPDSERFQHPYLYHVPSSRRVALGHFPTPEKYTGEWRCDTHPRSSRDGRTVCIDSPHDRGRQLYLIDISHYTAGSRRVIDCPPPRPYRRLRSPRMFRRQPSV
jgi:hypothetical protein